MVADKLDPGTLGDMYVSNCEISGGDQILGCRSNPALKPVIYLPRSPEYRIHQFCRLFLQSGDHMAVRVHSQADGAVAENLHHHSWWEFLSNKQACA